MQAVQKKGQYQPKYNQSEVPPNAQNMRVILKKMLASDVFVLCSFLDFLLLRLMLLRPDQFHIKLPQEISPATFCCAHHHREYSPKLTGSPAVQNRLLDPLRLKYVQIPFSFKAKHSFSRRMIWV